MYPILFRIWSFPVNTYGVFLALAFLCAIFVTVKLGVRDAQRVEVTDGLEDGAEVVVGPVAGLNDGDYVLAQ